MIPRGGYSYCVVDLIWHMAKVNAKSEGEAPAAMKSDPNQSKAQIDQEAIKDK